MRAIQPHKLGLRASLPLLAAALLCLPSCSDEPAETDKKDPTDAGAAADAVPEEDGAEKDVATATDLGSAAEDVPVLEGCAAACQPFSACYSDISQEECIELCDAPASADDTKKCLQESNHCLPLAKCLGRQVKVEKAFDAAAAGFEDYERAGDFFVKTARGTLSFSQRWTGADNWFFVARSGGYSYTEELWNSSMDDVFKNMPANSHIVFTAFKDKGGADNAVKHVGDIKASVDAALAKLPKKDRYHWSRRVHFVTERLPLPGEQASSDHAGGWLGEMASNRGRFCYAVDAQQQVRSCGNLRFPPNSSGVKRAVSTLSFLGRHFNFERERAAELAKQTDVQEITVFDDLGTTSQLIRYVKLPDAQALAKFDRMQLDMSVQCIDHSDNNCAARAEIAHLALCDLPSETTAATNVACNTELGRWSLPDGREGRWVTEAGPLLALLKDGGKRKFKLWTPEQVVKDGNTDKFITLKYTLKLRLWTDKATARPDALQVLWAGALGKPLPFDPTYNPAHPAQQVTIPGDAKKVELFALISGHGWGTDEANCATFCKQQHVFSVGGKDFTLDLDNAGTSTGCAQLVGKGATPNQYANWQYGRAGWCTGMDVRPYIADITKAVQPGKTASIAYKALQDGKPYKAEKKKDPPNGSFDAEMLRSVYLVIHR